MSNDASIWLYGSHARGDADSLSDVDLLVVCDAEWSIERLAKVFTLNEGSTCSISRYSWSEFGMMAERGSLFLHHVRSEGVLLHESVDCSGAVRSALEKLGYYRFAHRDVEAFQMVLSDVYDELQLESPIEYELAVLGTVIRHASVLGCYLLGRPCFGRTEPVRRFSAVANLPSGFAHEFANMYRYRLALEGRRCETPQIDRGGATQWLNRAVRIVSKVGGLCDGER